MTGYPNDQSNPAGAIPGYQTCGYTQVTASGAIKASPGYLAGIVCVASSSGVIAVYDNTAGSGTVIYTASIAAGAVVSFPAQIYATTGLYFTLVSGTATINVLWR